VSRPRSSPPWCPSACSRQTPIHNNTDKLGHSLCAPRVSSTGCNCAAWSCQLLAAMAQTVPYLYAGISADCHVDIPNRLRVVCKLSSQNLPVKLVKLQAALSDSLCWHHLQLASAAAATNNADAQHVMCFNKTALHARHTLPPGCIDSCPCNVAQTPVSAWCSGMWATATTRSLRPFMTSGLPCDLCTASCTALQARAICTHRPIL
jgi:hypothetical protein